MVLTCPACGTQYVVKDGAIPSGGRRVRCASCKHSWHQDAEPSDADAEAEAVATDAGDDQPEPIQPDENLRLAEADDADIPPPGYAAVEPVAPAAEQPQDQSLSSHQEAADAPIDRIDHSGWEPPSGDEQVADEQFSPFADRDEGADRGPGKLRALLVVALLLALIAAAFWFLAPAEWKARLGLATAVETPLQLMMTHSDRQRLASGNELLAISGRVINPTEESQPVPPIVAQLRSSSGELVYSWTISPPARTLGPGESKPFNSAEVDIPAGGDQLTITLGQPRA